MSMISTQTLTKGDLLSIGAEAKVFEGKFLGVDVICKERISKSYRDPSIDYKLRKERTTQEVRVLNLATSHKIPVPKVLDVEKSDWTIIMEKIQGNPLKVDIDQISIEKIFKSMGKIVAELHSLNIIHGDLTTSNILHNKGKVWFIDFGLSYISTHIEDRAVDILVLKHTLESSHSRLASNAFQQFINTYQEEYDGAEEVIDRLSVVENRVRYRSHGVA